MSTYFQKPENALRRAHELLNLPNSDPAVIKRQKNAALQLLHDVLVSKRHRTWQKTHEEIILLYLDISIDLQLSRAAKDGLHQYRNMTLQQNPASLELVIRHLISKAEDRAREAKLRSNELSTTLDNLDLEATQSPEAILLSTTTSDDTKDRTDRALLVPWLRFLWESYRTILEILRFNSQLEKMYREVCLKAFAFCVEYNRRIEFHRLCDILRNHLNAIHSNDTSSGTQHQSRAMRSWEGWTTESFELHLQLRYEQLEVATKLELWHEGFRTVEDINLILSIVGKTPKASLRAIYHNKLSQIFWVSKNTLFHAFSLQKYLQLSASKTEEQITLKNKTAEEVREIVSKVVLATICVDLYQETDNQINYGEDIEHQKMQKMSALLGVSNTPKRSSLIHELKEKNWISKEHCLPEVSELFALVEDNFELHNVVSKARDLLTKIGEVESLKIYVPAVERLIVQRLLVSLSKIYSKVKLSAFKKIIGDQTHLNIFEVERMIVVDVKKGRYACKIDHLNQSLGFGSVSFESRHIRNHLTEFGKSISSVVASINSKVPEFEASKKHNDALRTERNGIYESTLKNLESVQNNLLARKVIIEKRKEDLERLASEKVKLEEMKKKEMERHRREQEKIRLEQDARRREEEKRQKIKDEIALKETVQMLNSIGQNTDKLQVEDLESIDKEKMIREAKERAQKEKEENLRKLKEQAKRLDYIVRATREAELPMLQKQQQEKRAAEEKEQKLRWQKYLEGFKAEYDNGIKQKESLMRMADKFKVFAKEHESRRQKEYEEKLAEHKLRIAVERMENKLENAYERREEELQREREEEEQRQREEEEERKREEEEEMRRIQEEKEEEERLKREKEMQEEAERALEREKEEQRLAAEKQRKEDEAKDWRRSDATSRATSNADDADWTHVAKPVRSSVGSSFGRRSERDGPRDGPRDDFRSRRGGGDSDGWRRGEAAAADGAERRPSLRDENRFMRGEPRAPREEGRPFDARRNEPPRRSNIPDDGTWRRSERRGPGERRERVERSGDSEARRRGPTSDRAPGMGRRFEDRNAGRSSGANEEESTWRRGPRRDVGERSDGNAPFRRRDMGGEKSEDSGPWRRSGGNSQRSDRAL